MKKMLPFLVSFLFSVQAVLPALGQGFNLSEIERNLSIIQVRIERIQELSEELDRGCTAGYLSKVLDIKRQAMYEIMKVKEAIRAGKSYEARLKRLRILVEKSYEYAMDAEECAMLDSEFGC